MRAAEPHSGAAARVLLAGNAALGYEPCLYFARLFCDRLDRMMTLALGGPDVPAKGFEP